MSGAELPPPIVAGLASLEALDASLLEKGTAEPGNGLYPRDGVVAVTDIEDELSRVTMPSQHNNIVWASGMAAMRETVNFAAVYMADMGTRFGDTPVLAYANQLYQQSQVYFEKEARKGVKIVGFNSGDPESVQRAIDEKGADVLFAETVVNSPDMPVLDLGKLLNHVRDLERSPVIILDNTLPLSTGIDFSTWLEPDDRVIVAESITKNLNNNGELGGVTYSPNIELMEALRRHKAHSGAVNSMGALPAMLAKLRQTIPGFHERNQAVFRSTSKIALALTEAKLELGSGADFDITYPTDPKHPNHQYASSVMKNGPYFFSPIVFATPTSWTAEGEAKLAYRMDNHPAVREQIKAGEVTWGQSFGLPKVRMLRDLDKTYVRFGGGFDLDDEDATVAAIKEAAADK